MTIQKLFLSSSTSYLDTATEKNFVFARMEGVLPFSLSKSSKMANSRDVTSLLCSENTGDVATWWHNKEAVRYPGKNERDFGKGTRSFFKMADEDQKKSVVRDICSFLMLSEDDDDLILLAHEGLKDLVSLGCERFAYKCWFVVKFIHFSETQPA